MIFSLAGGILIDAFCTGTHISVDEFYGQSFFHFVAKNELQSHKNVGTEIIYNHNQMENVEKYAIHICQPSNWNSMNSVYV